MPSASAFSFSPLYSNVEPSGTKDGVNPTFTLPNSHKYVVGTLMVFLNGQMYQPISIDQTDVTRTTFTIVSDNLPTSLDVLHITYLRSLS